MVMKLSDFGTNLPLSMNSCTLHRFNICMSFLLKEHNERYMMLIWNECTYEVSNR
jgi:hypothetical protein